MSTPDVLKPIDFDSINTKNDLFDSRQTQQTPPDRIPSPSSLEHVLLLDYDDTLIPTSYLLSSIDYNINQKTKRIISFSINKKFNQTQTKQFISNLEKVGNATFKFLTKIFVKFKSSNIKIVTNGVEGWLPQSLSVLATFCPLYNKIKNILNQHEIEIMYARNSKLEQMHWKRKCFDKILWQYFNGENSSIHKHNSMNIVTIGDQWRDHTSIKDSLTYYIYGHSIVHHQIKLFPNPNCRYLCVELNYISSLLDEELLFAFNSLIHDNIHHQEGLVLEFDGYNDDKDI